MISKQLEKYTCIAIAILTFANFGHTLAQKQEKKYILAESGLLIRDSPSINGKVIGKLDYGDSIDISTLIVGDKFDHKIVI